MYGANLATIPDGVDGRKALEEVRRRVFAGDGPAPGSLEADVPYLRSDHMLVRFLIARQWDVEKAVAMLREHYKWLANSKMSALLQDPFPEEAHIKRYYPQAYHGTDKQGRPLYIERLGAMDMPRLLQATTPERLLAYISASCELQIRRRLPACSLMKGEVVDKSLNIMDLDGLGFRMVTHSTARRVTLEVVKILQNHYPECAGRTIIINAPPVFSLAWSLVKPMLDEKTVAKISIFGTNKEAYSAALLELVDPDQLPALFGGTCICDGKDKLSCMRCVKGPWGDEAIRSVLDREPLEEIMTPAGCRRLYEQSMKKESDHEQEQQQDQLQDQQAEPALAAADIAEPGEAGGQPEVTSTSETSGAAEGASAAANAQARGEEEEASAPASSSTPPPATAQARGEEEEDGDGEERDSFAAGLPSIPNGGRQGAPSAELQRAELEATLLQEEYRQHEEAHMLTLTEWVNEFNNLVTDIGRPVIERAQGYYDSRSLWQQAVQEYARQKEEVEKINASLDVAVKTLSKAEAAFEASMTGGPGCLSAEEWASLAPLPEELDDGEAKLEGRESAIELSQGDERLLRTLRLSALGDRVAALQWRRDMAAADLSAKNRELDESRRRFEQEDQLHSSCTWNCSVKRAAPFYDRRRMHETTVDAQLAVLRSLERRLQQARQTVAALEVASGGQAGLPALVTRSRSRQLDEMSLQSFEIAGAEARDDEFLSCCGSDFSDDDRKA